MCVCKACSTNTSHHNPFVRDLSWGTVCVYQRWAALQVVCTASVREVRAVLSAVLSSVGLKAVTLRVVRRDVTVHPTPTSTTEPAYRSLDSSYLLKWMCENTVFISSKSINLDLWNNCVGGHHVFKMLYHFCLNWKILPKKYWGFYHSPICFDLLPTTQDDL